MKNLKPEERAAFALRQLYSQYGYLPYKLSRFEEYELYARNKDFLGSDRIITFSDSTGRLLAMKPDVTLSIVKNAPQEPGVIQKVYYNENVYRDFREMMQTGLECVGDLGDYEIAEVTVLAAKSMALLGKPFVLEISHVGLISAVLEPLNDEARRTAMQCLRRKSGHELKEVAGECWPKLKEMLACRNDLRALAGVLTTGAEKNALAELSRLLQLVRSAGFERQVRVDFSVSSDLKYYSGVVFQGFLAGIPRAVLSGGQYDRLPRKLGRNSRAIGFAIGLDLLAQPQPQEPVDTLILHDGADCAALMEAVERYAREGSVLAAKRIPEGRTFRQIIRLGRDGQ